jgi:hypothetical protein
MENKDKGQPTDNGHLDEQSMMAHRMAEMNGMRISSSPASIIINTTEPRCTSTLEVIEFTI